jgi:hypothetical protein
MMHIKNEKYCKIFRERRVALPAHSARHSRLYGHPVPNLKNQKDTSEVSQFNHDILYLWTSAHIKRPKCYPKRYICKQDKD